MDFPGVDEAFEVLAVDEFVQVESTLAVKVEVEASLAEKATTAEDSTPVAELLLTLLLLLLKYSLGDLRPAARSANDPRESGTYVLERFGEEGMLVELAK